MQGQKLRRADFVTSLILLGFGVWMLLEAFKMPMRDTFGGVQNVWYVSPALFPLIVSIGILVLATVLLLHAIRSGGAAALVHSLKHLSEADREPLIRFGGILLGLVSFVYLYIPRVDFFLATILMLFYFIAAYYLDDHSILKRLIVFYCAGCVLFIVLFATPLAGSLNRLFAYATDIVALLFFVAMVVFVRRATRGRTDQRARIRLALIVTFVTPLILIPVFRYFLRVQMPREGGIIEIMHLIYYSIR
ncbi:MAG: hypothetical protein EA404_16020 [Spirochaetaceae bacterium]|nr:MAG: hypothetical protein EA404_16020 [Spirochaetaceae bacterium]